MGRTLQWRAPDGTERRGSLDTAAGDDRRGAVLVVADEGPTADFARRLARELLAAGFDVVCLAAGELGGVRGDRACTAELEAALGALAAAHAGGTLALVGVGAFGTQAFLCACASRRLAAVVDVCGPLVHTGLDAEHPVQPLDMVLNLGVPVLLVHAADDERFGSAAAAAAQARIERALQSAERNELPGRARDFLDPTSPGYHADRAERALHAIATFLRDVSDE